MKRVMRISDDGHTHRYRNIVEAARDVDGQASHISECMRNIEHRKTHKGYRWEESSYDTMGTAKN